MDCRKSNFLDTDYDKYYDEPVNRHMTVREMQALRLLVQGNTNQQIADKMGIKLSTAKAHVGHILYKLQAKGRIHAAIRAIKNDII